MNAGHTTLDSPARPLMDRILRLENAKVFVGNDFSSTCKTSPIVLTFLEQLAITLTIRSCDFEKRVTRLRYSKMKRFFKL